MGENDKIVFPFLSSYTINNIKLKHTHKCGGKHSYLKRRNRHYLDHAVSILSHVDASRVCNARNGYGKVQKRTEYPGQKLTRHHNGNCDLVFNRLWDCIRDTQQSLYPDGVVTVRRINRGELRTRLVVPMGIRRYCCNYCVGLLG